MGFENSGAGRQPARGIVGCILAGGQSRRMGGGDKSLRPLGGRPMIAHVIERLAPQVDAMVINANGDPARFASFGLPVTADPLDGFVGPLGGVLAGLRWAERHAPAARFVATVATDTPFFPDDLVARLAAAAGTARPTIALARSADWIHPVFGLWPVALVEDLQHAIEVDDLHKVLVWVRRHPNVEVPFDPIAIAGRSFDPFFNINTPDDMASAEALLAEKVR